MDDKRLVQSAAWSISALAFIIGIIAWLQSFDWEIPVISPYLLFPLFGILAFSVMWSHYIASVLRQIANLDKPVLAKYFEITSYVALLAFCLHPGLLVWQLWRDGNGLPPGSVYGFVSPSLGWVVTLGVVSLCVFLAYEFRRLYEKKSWWKYVGYATDAAMLAIFYHGLRLGSQLSGNWFQMVWIFYGVTLILSLVYIHSERVRRLVSFDKIP